MGVMVRRRITMRRIHRLVHMMHLMQLHLMLIMRVIWLRIVLHIRRVLLLIVVRIWVALGCIRSIVIQRCIGGIMHGIRMQRLMLRRWGRGRGGARSIRPDFIINACTLLVATFQCVSRRNHEFLRRRVRLYAKTVTCIRGGTFLFAG